MRRLAAPTNAAATARLPAARGETGRGVVIVIAAVVLLTASAAAAFLLLQKPATASATPALAAAGTPTLPSDNGASTATTVKVDTRTVPPPASGSMLQNPLIVDHADPGTFYHEGWFYSAATPSFTMFKSKDLKAWQPLGPALKREARGGTSDFWAPNFCRLPDGSWLMVYTANRKLYLAKSASPQGEYTFHAGPLLGGRWAIDGMAFVDPSTKKTYLYWNESHRIFCGELVNNTTVVSNDAEIFSSKSQPEAWVTEVVNEAPFVFFRNGTYYCAYSGNGTGPKYGIGVATAPSPTGPWRKHPANPVIWGFGAKKTRGTGHCTVVSIPGGPWLMFYHASPGGTRDLFVDVIEWKGAELTVPGAPSRQLPNPLAAL